MFKWSGSLLTILWHIEGELSLDLGQDRKRYYHLLHINMKCLWSSFTIDIGKQCTYLAEVYTLEAVIFSGKNTSNTACIIGVITWLRLQESSSRAKLANSMGTSRDHYSCTWKPFRVMLISTIPLRYYIGLYLLSSLNEAAPGTSMWPLLPNSYYWWKHRHEHSSSC